MRWKFWFSVVYKYRLEKVCRKMMVAICSGFRSGPKHLSAEDKIWLLLTIIKFGYFDRFFGTKTIVLLADRLKYVTAGLFLRERIFSWTTN